LLREGLEKFPLNDSMRKIIKVGLHSLAVIIPADFVHSLGLRAGDKVKIQIDKTKGKISLFFSGIKQLPLPTPFKKRKI